jgi:hypothetical protein
MRQANFRNTRRDGGPPRAPTAQEVRSVKLTVAGAAR